MRKYDAVVWVKRTNSGVKPCRVRFGKDWRMRIKSGSKKAFWIKSFALSIIAIAFFVSIILTYYNALIVEKRNNIIRDGMISAWQVETRFNEYLSTSVDAIEMTAYTLEGMVADKKSGEEILDYLIGQSTAVINTIFENTMGVYGYISGGYYDGAGWIPDEGFEPKTRPWYTEAAANNGAVTLIDPYLDLQSGTVMMSLAKMLNDGDSVVAMDIYLDRIQEITEEVASEGDSAMELILDAHDVVIAHSDPSEVGKDYRQERGTLAAAIMEQLNASDDELFEFYYNDSHYIAYRSRLQNDWLCLFVKDATSVFKPLERILLLTVIVVAAVVFILVAFLSRYSQKNLTIESLTEEAMLDKLTGFLNKAGTAAKLPELCRTETGMLAVLDLDSFKLVNDLYGHDIGDRVLASFAAIVRQNTRGGDVHCRIGGDEFMLFCRNVTDGKFLVGMTKRLNSQLAAECRRLMGEDFGIPIGVSMGAVAVPEQGREYQQLFPLADKALYQVKQNGKHGCVIYSPTLNADDPDTDTIVGELSRITQILDERGKADAALWLGQEAFTSVYRFMRRAVKHGGEPASKLLFLVCATSEGSVLSLQEASDRFGVVLGDVLGAQDVILQSKPTQFLVLLPGGQNVDAVVDRVLEEWCKTPQHEHFSVTYATEPLASDDPESD